MTRTPFDFLTEAKKIVAKAEEEGVVLRIMGACAVKHHCMDIHQLMDREITDMDFMSSLKHKRGIQKLLMSMRYVPNERFNLYHGRERLLYYAKYRPDVKIDVFFDKLLMCHDIDFRGRLKVDYPTIPLADILLEKMQIVKIADKDLDDIIILLRGHPIGETDMETINMPYIAKILARDWGFYYTVTTNIENVKNRLEYCDALSKEDKDLVLNRIEKLSAGIENEPKTFGWKIRAKIGTKKKWYEEVGEI